MALAAYLTQTQRLLNDENAQFFSLSDLTAYINIGRNTIATQSECLIADGQVSTVNGTQSYALANITAPNAGLLQPVNIRSIISVISDSGNVLDAEPWAYFVNYYRNGSNYSSTGTPTIWAVQSPGTLGNIWFWPTPNGTVLMTVEATWLPIPLASDSDPEALTYPYTDAIPYFAAAMAYLNAQRQSGYEKMFNTFNAYMKAAKVGVTPDIQPINTPTLKGLQSGIDAQMSNQGQNIRPSQGGEGQLG